MEFWGIASRLLMEGEVYTVIGEATDTDGQGYLLEEVKHPQHSRLGFRKRRFIPLSEIDETERVNEEEREAILM